MRSWEAGSSRPNPSQPNATQLECFAVAGRWCVCVPTGLELNFVWYTYSLGLLFFVDLVVGLDVGMVDRAREGGKERLLRWHHGMLEFSFARNSPSPPPVPLSFVLFFTFSFPMCASLLFFCTTKPQDMAAPLTAVAVWAWSALCSSIWVWTTLGRRQCSPEIPAVALRRFWLRLLCCSSSSALTVVSPCCSHRYNSTSASARGGVSPVRYICDATGAHENVHGGAYFRAYCYPARCFEGCPRRNAWQLE